MKNLSYREGLSNEKPLSSRRGSKISSALKKIFCTTPAFIVLLPRAFRQNFRPSLGGFFVFFRKKRLHFFYVLDKIFYVIKHLFYVLHKKEGAP